MPVVVPVVYTLLAVIVVLARILRPFLDSFDQASVDLLGWAIALLLQVLQRGLIWLRVEG